MLRKILYVHYVPNLGGAATSLLTLIKFLDRQRFVPHILFTHQQGGEIVPYWRSLGLPVDHVPVNLVWDHPWFFPENIRSKAWKSFRADPEIVAYLEKLRPDVVHINEFMPTSVGISAHRLNIPVIWHCRHVLQYTRPLIDPGRRIIQTMVDCSKRIIAISESEAPQFNSAKTVVVYNPLDLDEIQRSIGKGKDIRQVLGIAAEEYVVLAPIPLSQPKGAWDFIEACGLAKRLAPSVKFKFLLTGSLPTYGRRYWLRRKTAWLGPEFALDRAKRMAHELNIENELIITGYRKDIYDIIDGCDLVIFPSRLRACGRQCFEAGALGKPIMVTLPDKNTRVVLDGKTGLVLPEKRPDEMGRAIADLALHPEEGRRMGQAGLEYVPVTFEAPKIASQVMRLYDDILSEEN